MGEWQLRQVSFVAERPLSPELQEQLDDSALAVLNEELRRGHTRQLVSFRLDGTYQIDHYEASAPLPARTENRHLPLGWPGADGSGPAAPHGSSLAQGHVHQLTARQLVRDFPFGPDSLCIFKQLAYTR